MNIRPATENDLQACEELSKIEEFRFADGGYPSKEFYSAYLDATYFLVAEENNEVIGFVVGEGLKHNLVMLWFLTVEESKRSQGIGKKLYEAFKENVEKLGSKHILLYSPTSNKRSHNFYRKLGFFEGATAIEFLKEL